MTRIILPGRPERLALLVAALSLLAAVGAASMGRAANPGTPLPYLAKPVFGDPARGRGLFVRSCAHCHGDDAHGSGEDGDGPDLSHLALGNARIAALIRTGIPEEMPSFAKKHTAPDIADLTAYLRSLR